MTTAAMLTPRTCETPDDLWLSRVQEYRRTVRDNPWIPHPPHPRQKRFLLLADIREILFGGAAGGGKSDALLMAAAQYVTVPGYAALLLRQNFPDLNQPDALIPRSKSWWKGKAHWHAQDKRWTFPSGATITFGYLDSDDAVYQYQSAAYQFIGFDELTQHSEWRYRYLFSRLRHSAEVPESVPLRMRAGTNPGGKGHAWVKKRFINPKTRVPGVVFVPSKLEDNPTLNPATYRESLRHLDPVTRDQLERGDWSDVEGGRFKRAWLRHYGRHGTTYRLGPNRFVEFEKTTQRFLTVDAAGTVKQTAGQDPDYTAISAWAYAQNQLLWLGCVTARVEVPEIPAMIAREYRLHGARKVYFRPSGMEKAVPQLCQRYEKTPMNIVSLKVRGDKLQSAADFLNMAEAGRVWLPADGCAYPHSGGGFPREDVEDQLLRFTGDDSGHDDVWDTAGIAGTVAERHIGHGGGVPAVVGGG